MHYNSWEWSNIISKHQKHEVLAIYKPMSSLPFNIFMNEGRERFGVTALKDSLTLRTVIDKKRKNELVFIWLAADQTPPGFHKFWMKFLNQDALFYPGPASISKRFNYPVFFQSTRKIKRGHYETSYELLFENPSEVSEAEIMRTFVEKMEALIKEAPEFYLWSHRRWKHKRPKDIPLQ
jgi:KDO2-lipid IV(A) lauroyltransferase